MRITQPPPPAELVLHDLARPDPAHLADPLVARRAWDEAHAVATIQGVVNRRRPRLYIRHVCHAGRDVDDHWLRLLRREGEWLHQTRLLQLASIEEVVACFSADLAGAVVYDEALPATSNLASTIAGVEDLVAIRHDPEPGSLFDRLVVGGPRLPVRCRLSARRGRLVITRHDGVSEKAPAITGSAKCDAYRWARARYLDQGRCSFGELACYIACDWIQRAAASTPEQHTLTNHDYFVARRAFFCDLSPWADETPADDSSQPLGADRRTFESILSALQSTGADQLIHVGGFTPWAFKYTRHPGAGGRHGEVETEWEMVRLVSAYNGFLDADAISHAAMANASLFQHFPLRDGYSNGASSVAVPERVGAAEHACAASGDVDHVVLYVGDYDSAAWLYQRAPDLWEDPRRGEVPLTWAISPVLERRAPMAMDHLWRTRSENDFFVSANNGAGYLNPSMLTAPRLQSGLPSGMPLWVRACKQAYRRWGLTITGFVIDGAAPPSGDEVLDAYAEVSPGGVVLQYAPRPAWLHKGMPVLARGPDLDAEDPAEAARALVASVAGRRAADLRFHWYRSILKSPSWHAELVREATRLDSRLRFVGAPAFFARLRDSLLVAPVADHGGAR